MPTINDESFNDNSHKNKKRFHVSTILAIILIILGLGAGGYVIYDIFGTTAEASGESEASYEKAEAEWIKPTLKVVESENNLNDVPIVTPSSEGELLGILHIPVLGEDYRAPLKEGESENVLKTGAAGRYSETANIGEIGNTGVAGHRLTRGNPFLHIDKVGVGEKIIVETEQAWLVYEVFGTEIVKPDDVEVLNPVPRSDSVPVDRLMTLTTCHPIWSDEERWITYSKLVGWTDRSEGIPVELEGLTKADTISNNETELK